MLSDIELMKRTLLLIYLQGATNPAAFNPALCFSLIYFASLLYDILYLRKERDRYTLKPCIRQAHFICGDDPHHSISWRDILALIYYDSRNISIIFELCFFKCLVSGLVFVNWVLVTWRFVLFFRELICGLLDIAST